MTMEGLRGLPHTVKFSFNKRNRTFVSVTEFTYINKYEKNNIKKS
jgi:hypothetical protein